jgi:preprotein translocase subunit SecF
MRFLEEPNFEFLRIRWIAFAASAAMFAVCFGSLLAKGGPKYSIDFAGGSLIQLRFPEAVQVDAIRTRLADLGAADAEIQRFGGPEEVLVRIPNTGGEGTAAQIKDALLTSWPGVELRREETVGPKVGGELRSAAVQSIILALVLILIYITFRFEFRWAVAAVIALVHDVIVTVGALSITDREFSLTVVAALLTIVGFSLNDTIVIFDRVRENLRVPTREPFDRLLNRSINQTLGRTIITSGTVLLTTLALLFFGGEVLNDFAFALTAGIISGTYSTVYVATAVVLEWERRWPRRSKLGARPTIAREEAVPGTRRKGRETTPVA